MFILEKGKESSNLIQDGKTFIMPTPFVTLRISEAATVTQLAFTCSKLTIETLEQCVK